MMGFKLATLYQQHKRPSLARRTASEVIRASYYDQEVTQAASTDVVAALDTLRTTTLQPLVIMKASPKKLQKPFRANNKTLEPPYLKKAFFNAKTKIYGILGRRIPEHAIGSRLSAERVNKVNRSSGLLGLQRRGRHSQVIKPQRSFCAKAGRPSVHTHLQDTPCSNASTSYVSLRMRAFPRTLVDSPILADLSPSGCVGYGSELASNRNTDQIDMLEITRPRRSSRSRLEILGLLGSVHSTSKSHEAYIPGVLVAESSNPSQVALPASPILSEARPIIHEALDTNSTKYQYKPSLVEHSTLNIHAATLDTPPPTPTDCESPQSPPPTRAGRLFTNVLAKRSRGKQPAQLLEPHTLVSSHKHGLETPPLTPFWRKKSVEWDLEREQQLIQLYENDPSIFSGILRLAAGAYTGQSSPGASTSSPSNPYPKLPSAVYCVVTV